MRFALNMALAATLVTFGSIATASAGEGTATDALKQRDADIRAALPPKGAPMTPEKKEKLQGILTKLVDLEDMAKSALGKHWEAQVPEKRKEFLDAFLAAFRKALDGEIEFYRSSDTTFEPEQKQKLENVVKVPTTLTVKDEPTEIVYTMKKGENGSWRIVDIEIDGVSTVQNYRASFGKIIAKEGFDGLITRLKKPKALGS